MAVRLPLDVATWVTWGAVRWNATLQLPVETGRPAESVIFVDVILARLVVQPPESEHGAYSRLSASVWRCVDRARRAGSSPAGNNDNSTVNVG